METTLSKGRFAASAMLTALAVLATIVLACFMMPSTAHAVPSKEAYLIHASGSTGTIEYYDSIRDAWVRANNGDTVGITRDVDLGKSVLSHYSGTRNLELNGHKLYKNKKKQSNIITVKSGATMNVYGGRLNWTVVGNKVTFDNTVLSGRTYSTSTGLASSYGSDSVVANNTAARMPMYLKAKSGSWHYTTMDVSGLTYKGGMIAGGWSSGDGGAIRLEGDSSRLKLTNVYMVGNTAENNGGAISMNGSYQRVDLDNSMISFNRAISKNGGAIYMGGKYGKLSMKQSHIEFNLADDNGGGVSATGEGCAIWGDAKAVDPSDKAYPSTKWQNRDKYNGDTFYNPYFGNGQMFANEYLRTQENQDAASTIAMNIVPDCDLNGGGGGVHTADEKISVAGLNIFRNYAGGSGATATWRGRGGGVELKNVKSSVSNCNIWKNWSRSEGGGIYVDNDKCSVSNITVTENYAHSNGWSGGGVYVLGTVNLAISGVCRIWGNTSAESGDKPHNDNLYLGYYNTMYARLYPELAKGSKIYLWMSGAGTTITKVKGDYDERMFYADESNWHVEYTSEKTLSLVKGKGSEAYLKEQYPPLTTKTITPDGALAAGSRTVKTDKTFQSKNNGKFAVYRGVAELPAFDDGAKDRTSTFFYSDGYFFDDPQTYEPHLATLSIHLAAASFYSNDGNQGGVLYGNKTGTEGKNFLNVAGDEAYYPVKSNNIRQFMSDIGIPESNIYLNDFNIQKPGPDTIGVAIGSKVLKKADGENSDKTLVVIGVRGAGYEQEWISNLTLGNKGEAQGFSSASKQVFAELNKYLDMKNIDGSSENTIFWIAGYSRAGATSNLTGKRIVDKYDKNCKHTFVYTFEAPQGGSVEDDPKANYENTYKCIHNVINEVDIVPKVGPSDMGFFRYGVDHYVPGGTAAGSEKETTYYNYYYQSSDHNSGTRIEKSYKTRSDNNVEKPGSKAYEANKTKMLKQLRAISGYNIVFNDYYHGATMQFVANKLFGNLGTQLIGEKNSSKIPKDAGAFGTQFLQNLMKSEFKFDTDRTKQLQNKDKFYRYNYSAMTREGMTFEKAIGSAAGVVFSLTPAQMQGLTGIGSTIMDRIDLMDFYLKFLNGSRSTRKVSDEIWKALAVPTDEGRAKGYVYLQDYLSKSQMETLGAAFPSLCDVLLNYLRNDYSATGCDWIGTFGYNAMRILQTHYPEISISWVRSYDNYYDNETAIYDIDSSAKITSKGNWHVAAKAKKLTYDAPIIELYVAGGSAQEADENRGASLYYWLDNDTTLHPYCGPMKLSANESEDTQHTIKAFSIHDGIMTTTQTINITVEKPDQTTWPVYGASPSSSESYEKHSERTVIGKAYTFSAPEQIGDKFFKEWQVKYSGLDTATGNRTYTTFHTGSSADQKAKMNAYLQGFDLTEPNASFVMNQMGAYEFVPVYASGIRSVRVDLNEVVKNQPLPTTSSVKIGNETTPATTNATTKWNPEGEESGEYTVVVTLPRKGYDRSLQATVERNDNNAPGHGGVTVARIGNPVVTTNGTDTFVSQRVKLAGYTEISFDAHTVKLSVISLNRNQELDETTTVTTNARAGEQVSITLPDCDGYTYQRMLQQSDTNGFEVTNLNGLKVEGNTLTFEMVDKDVSLVAGYVPVVNEVAVMLDRNLEAGKTRPNVKWVDFGIGTTDKQTWRIESGYSESWKPKDVEAKGVALDFNTKYGVTIMRVANSKDELKGYRVDAAGQLGSNPDGTSGTPRPVGSPNSGGKGLVVGQSLDTESTGGETPEVMTGQFKLASDVTYKVYYLPEVEEGAPSTDLVPQEIQLPDNAVYPAQTRWGSFINFEFNPTRKAQVVDVLDPEPVEVDYTDSPEIAVLSNKPATVLYEDGTSMEVPVQWGSEMVIDIFADDDEDSELSKQRDGYVAWVGGSLPETVPVQGDAIPEELQTVFGTIVVSPLPQSEEPWGYLRSGDIYGPAEDYEDIIQVGADDTNSVKLELYADDGSFILYHVDDGDGDDDYWDWPEYDSDSDGIEIGWGDAEVPNGTTKTVTVQARAAQVGCLMSELAEYEFTLVKVPSTVTHAVTTKAVCGDTQLFATTTGGGEYTTGTEVTLSAPGSFAVGDTVYKFKQWKADPESVAINPATVATATFAMPKSDVAATAEYEVAGVVAEPVPSLMPGEYTLAADEPEKQLTLSAMEGADIYYTMTADGSEPDEPTAGSTKYAGPIALAVDAGQTGSFKVKAIAMKSAGGSSASSSVATFSYHVTRLQPSYLVSVASGSIANVADATSIPEGASTDRDVYTKGVFAKGSSVAVVADDVADKVFKEWSAEGVQLTDEQKSKARMSFTMPGNAVNLAATYADKVNSIVISGFDEGKSFNGNITDRPQKVTYTTNVSAVSTSAPLLWDKGDTVANADGSTTTTWTASFAVTNTDPGFASAVQVTGDEGWTVAKATGASVTVQKQVSYTDTSTMEYTVKVLCYDVNIDQVVDSYDYEFIQEDLTNNGGSYQQFIGAPAVENEFLDDWMAEGEQLSGLDEESDWSQKDGVYASVAGSAAEGATVSFPQNKTNVVVVAKYVPVINQIEVDVDEPVAGQQLPDKVNSVFVTATDTYSSLPVKQENEGEDASVKYVDIADMLVLAWSGASGAIPGNKADYDTTYTATIKLKDEYKNQVSFIIDPDADIVVNTTQISYDELVFGEDAISFAQASMHANFATDKVKLLAVSTPTELTVSNSNTTSWPLPSTVTVITEKGTELAPVSWNMAGISLLESTPTDTMKIEVYSVPGQVSLPSSIDANGLSLAVDLTVRNNQPVPVSAAPTTSLDPGTYYAKQQLKLSAAQGADIYYTLGADDPVDGIRYSDAEGVMLTGEPGESITHTVRTVAVETGKLPSQVAEFTYAIELSATVDKNGLVDAIVAAKKAMEGVKTSADGSDVLVSEFYTTAAERKALDDAIAAAQKAADNPDAAQEDVDGALAALKAATDAFNKAKKAGKKPSYGPGEDPNQMGEDGTPLGKGASAAAADRAITSMEGDADPAGTRILPLKLRSKKQAKGSIKAQWSRASGAKTYVLYGNASGKRYKMVKLATTDKPSFTVKAIDGKKLKKGTYHKFILVALDENNNVVSTSKVIHVSTKGNKKKANPAKVTIARKVIKKAKKLKQGKGLKLGAKVVNPRGSKVAKRVAMRYESSNPAVAVVNAKGVVKAKSKGKAKIIAYAQNGASKVVKVVVK